MRPHACAATAAWLACAGTVMAAAEWPEFHGPARDNKSAETGLLKAWPADGPKLLWTADGLGIGYSTVSVAGGTIYTAGKIGNQTHVFALDMAGQRKWQAANGQSWNASEKMRYAIHYDGARATPTVDGDRVYHLGELGRLAAFDAKTGKEIWSLNVMDRFGAKLPKYGYAQSVLIDGQKLFCYVGGSKGAMVALDKATGKTLWANTDLADRVAFSSPILVDFAGRRLLVAVNAWAVVGLDSATGERLWRYEYRNPRSNNIACPIHHDDGIYASSGYGKGSVMLKLKAADGEVGVEEVWETKLLDNHHGGVVLVDGCLYGAGHYSRGWHCLDLATGAPRYCHKSFAKGSVMFVDGMLYCLGEKGTMALVKATPQGFVVVSRFRVPRGGEGLYWAHPVAVGSPSPAIGPTEGLMANG